MQSGASYSGLRGVQIEDAVAQASMGAISDRSSEFLGSSDVAVVRMRRLLLQSVRNFKESANPPLGLAEPVAYRELRGEEKIIPLNTAWQSN